MEILRDVRTQRGGIGVGRRRAAHGLAFALRSSLLLLAGCGGCWGRGSRDSATADSAVIHALAGKDTASVFKVPPTSGGGTAEPPVEIIVTFPEPASVLAADSSAGQRIYRRSASCIACHGGRAEGVAGMGSSVSDKEWLRGDGSLSFLFATIRNGIADPGAAGATRAVMPGVGAQLSAREIFQVAAFVYSLSHSGAVVTDSAALPAGAPPIAHAPPDTSRR